YLDGEGEVYLANYLANLKSSVQVLRGVNNCTIKVLPGDPNFNLNIAIALAITMNPSLENYITIELCTGIYMVDNSAGPVDLPGYISIYAPAGRVSTVVAPVD